MKKIICLLLIICLLPINVFAAPSEDSIWYKIYIADKKIRKFIDEHYFLSRAAMLALGLGVLAMSAIDDAPDREKAKADFIRILSKGYKSKFRRLPKR